MPVRNRLRKVRLSELSLVDRPANPHAVVVIAKRQREATLTFREAYRVLTDDRLTTPRERLS